MPDEAKFLLRALGAGDLAVVRAWRNHPDIRRYMLSQHVISAEEHRAWFDRCSCEPARRLYILECEGRPMGFAQLTNVGPGGTADWGFYVAPDAPRGTGTELGRNVLSAAFDVERLNKVCGQALESNEASQRLHLRLGFRQEGKLREQVRIDSEYRGLVCYGILAREYMETKS
jgi:UDP-4-amino-4,6-dideoxy-N-acetyl-beta-L-altrosamine N-acetyltransferase